MSLCLLLTFPQTLVWYGGVTETVSNEEVKRLRVQDFGPCDFRGEKGNHLCMSEQVRGQRRKHVVMDTSYEFAAVMHAPLNSTAPNMHEFNMVSLLGWEENLGRGRRRC